ncbi:hypothetical protein M8818_002908 [Zalaria obscura]|uniref:Uncharacterized protein n=1 Tax=Zalaria obscura TaxID=2024903 RepID=A0ACC3SKC9_9PEZI
MGPATAVLILPSLQWVDTTSIGIGTFDRMNSDAPPNPEGFFAVNLAGDCEEYDTDFSCLADYWAVSLDAFITTSIDGGRLVSQQGYLIFGFNGTYEVSSNKTTSDFTYWIPNRQTLHDLEMDFFAVGEISTNVPANESGVPATLYDSYVPYNKSLQTQLQRSGPIVGCLPNMWLGSPWHDLNVTVVDSDRSIRCYEGYDISNTPRQEDTATGNYTKCIRTGTGWNQANKQAGFTVSGPINAANQTDPGVAVDLYFSDAAAFFPPGSPPAWLNEGCLINGTVAQGLACDWDRFFSTDGEGSMTNRSSSVNTIEITMMASNHSTAVMVMVDYVAFLNFTTYALDPSPSTNPLFLVQNPQLPSTGSPLVIDPSWTLVAWSATNGSSLSPNRSTTLTLLNVMSNALTDPNYELYDDPLLDDISLLPVVQTLSLIDFSYTNSSAPFSHDPVHPILHRNARLYVWAFGITSRTAILGTIVTTLGIFVVLTQFMLGLAYPKMKRHLSPTELLVAALRHVPLGEFDIIGDEETELAKVRFQVQVKEGSPVQYVSA